MRYDIWNLYDPSPEQIPAERARLGQRLVQIQQDFHVALLDVRPVIENPRRDIEQVYAVLRPFHEYSHDIPAHPGDLPEIEALCRLVLEKGGPGQSHLQEVLLRLVGNSASPKSLPFLLEMLCFSRRGDSFGPQRRLLAMWGLARLARWHNLPEAYEAVAAGLLDRNAEVRWTSADLILNAYLDARRDVSAQIVAKLHQMAHSDPDDEVRRVVGKYLDEPWAREPEQPSTLPAPGEPDKVPKGI